MKARSTAGRTSVRKALTWWRHFAPELIHRLSAAPRTAGTVLARTRRQLREEVDALFEGRPEVAAVLRAMLLGDRSFIERDEAVDFQKTGVFHVLVVAGLHVGALAFFLYWFGRKLRLSRLVTMVFTLALLFAYSGDRATAAGAASGVNGSDCGARRLFLSKARRLEFGGDSGFDTFGGTAAGVT